MTTDFTEYSRTVEEGWIDYNGHMNEVYYSHVLVEANEAFLDHLGLGADYARATGNGMYTVESHLYFLKECLAGETLRASSRVLEVRPKVLRVETLVRNDRDEEVLRGESVYVHMGSDGAVPLADERYAALGEHHQ